jgi:hypothetical protein
MIMRVEAVFYRVHEQFQAIVTNLEKAAKENRPIHEVEQELVEELRTLGRSAVEAFIERQGDGDVGETVQHERQPLKRLPEMSCGAVYHDILGFSARVLATVSESSS